MRIINFLSASFMNAETLYYELVQQIKDNIEITQHVAIVGIYSGGALLAKRLAIELKLTKRLGFIDVSFYRDDFKKKGLCINIKPSKINFDVEGAIIILIDDVLYTGRTARAAMNELFDYGRPARIFLATLIDRDGRELPISADFLAKTLSLSSNILIQLKQRTDNGKFFFRIVHD